MTKTKHMFFSRTSGKQRVTHFTPIAIVGSPAHAQERSREGPLAKKAVNDITKKTVEVFFF